MPHTKAVLIVGGSGFVGTHLALKLREAYKVYATYHRTRVSMPGVTYIPLNAGKRDWTKRVVRTFRPEIIIYAGGRGTHEWLNPNFEDPEEVFTSGAVNVASVAEILQPRYIYVSSCMPFDGLKGNYHESDLVLPNTDVGKAKLAGENQIRTKSMNYVIVRSTPLLGRSNGWNLSMIDRLRIRLDRGERVELSQAELHGFAPIQGFTDFIEKLLDSGIKNRIVHYGGLTRCSWYDMGCAVARKFGYDPSLIVEGAHAPHGVADYSLNCTYAVENLKIKPLLLEQGLDLLQESLISRP